MGSLYLRDLADKTRRGLRGRIEAGKSGGGLCHGYDVLRRLSDDGQPIRGGRMINPAQAAIVVRIFRDYAAGKSSRGDCLGPEPGRHPGPVRQGLGAEHDPRQPEAW